jgi:hypothetical protein
MSVALPMFATEHKHIGERAIPAFFEGFHGDDEFNRARPIEQDR